MSNVFKRPMFRRGGGVNMNGIMSGIRDEYEEGGPTARERYEQIIKNYENPAMDPLSKLLIQGGLRGLSETRGGGTLANLAMAFQEPTDQLFSDLQRRKDLQREAELAGLEMDIADEKERKARIQAVEDAEADREFRKQLLEQELTGRKEIDIADEKERKARIQAVEDAEADREFRKQLLEQELTGRKEIEGIKRDGDIIPKELLEKYDRNEIKAGREQDFYKNKFKELQGIYGEESVATDVIDSSLFQKKGSLDTFVKQNPQLARQVIYDVQTGKPVRVVIDTVTNKYKIVPADAIDTDETDPEAPPQKEKNRDFSFLSEDQRKKLKEIQESSDKQFYIY